MYYLKTSIEKLINVEYTHNVLLIKISLKFKMKEEIIPAKNILESDDQNYRKFGEIE